MPINIPENLPAIEALKEENIFIMGINKAESQDIRPLRIAILNLMPKKIMTETELVRLLSNTPLQIEADFIKLDTHVYKNAPSDHMKTFYKSFAKVRKQKYDGLIMTGAPVEHLPFEEVIYWEEYKEILDWARDHVTSSLFICWSAQAALYHYYGIPKYPLDKKMFGVFEHHKNIPFDPIFRGFDDVFYVPHSRHTEIHQQDICKVPQLTILAESKDAGVNIVKSEKNNLFITGHCEYSSDTLATEYHRDVAKDLPIELPKNYFLDDDPAKPPVVRWRSHANLLFINWLNYYVYQETPYDSEMIGKHDSEQ
jgi:homoserine O-succinyltransferase/O-acetyltransferase